ncbi:uncharacterized protein ARMOST_21784 [Armillaria ostoyae]|uniref:Uncharacterized protein n=1 Tax=Armillaria ostoyae TaxID=47428 RepID=A0A284SB60_ARMOS|nr:uncharacterized protein ARMOST_21784 [Armillaria ostoyae]
MALAGALQLDNTVGTFEIAVTIASLLIGVPCVQVWKYSNDYQRDPWYMKAPVMSFPPFSVTFISDCVSAALNARLVYSYTVTHWGDIDVLVSIPWSFLGLVTASVCGFVAFIVQLFYVYRIWRLSNGNYLLTCLLAAISVAEFIVNMYAVDGARRITVYTDQVKIKPYLLAYNALGAVDDCLLARTMMLLLKSRTRFKKTNTMITRLVGLSFAFSIQIFLLAFREDDALCKYRHIYKVCRLSLRTDSASHLGNAAWQLYSQLSRYAYANIHYFIYSTVQLAIWDETMIDHPLYFALPRLYGASLFGLLNAHNDIRNGTPNNGYSSNEILLSLALEVHIQLQPQSKAYLWVAMGSHPIPALG